MARARRRRLIQEALGDDTIALLDVLSNGLGACILLFLVFGAINLTAGEAGVPSTRAVVEFMANEATGQFVLMVHSPSADAASVPLQSLSTGQSRDIRDDYFAENGSGTGAMVFTRAERSETKPWMRSIVAIPAQPGQCIGLRIVRVASADDGATSPYYRDGTTKGKYMLGPLGQMEEVKVPDRIAIPSKCSGVTMGDNGQTKQCLNVPTTCTGGL